MKVSRFSGYYRDQIKHLKEYGVNAKAILRYKLEIPDANGVYRIVWQDSWLSNNADNTASSLPSSQ
jgi:hypothetical protein